VVAALVATASPAAAQSRPAFSVERFTPAPGPGGFGAVEDFDVLPAWNWTTGVWVSQMARPIVLRDATSGDDAGTPVTWRLGMEAHAAIGLAPRYQLGVAVPWAVQDGDRLAGTGLDDAPLRRTVLGDVRLHARARLAGAPGAPGMAAALSGTWIAPSGDADHFAGESSTALEWRLVAGWRGAAGAVAGNLGVRLRTQEIVFLSESRPHGNEIQAGVAGAAALPWFSPAQPARAHAIAEVAAVLGDAVRAGARGPSPVELRLGLRSEFLPGWSATLIGGAGLTPDEVGAPAWRIAFGVTAGSFGSARPSP
jgi:hypothetical protein